MELVKLLKDYSKNRQEKGFGDFMFGRVDTVTCVEKIKNKDFMIKYLQPLNDFIIYTTELPCSNVRKVNI